MKMKPSARSPYLELVQHRSALVWLFAVNLTRWPMAIAPLALVLLGRAASGSFALGGGLVAANMAGEVLLAPLAARLLDRVRSRFGLYGLLAGTAGVWLVLGLSALNAAPAPWLLFLAGVAGALPASAAGGIRAVLPQLVPAGLLEFVFGLDATVLEVVWILAPLAVAIVITTGSVLNLAVLAAIPVILAIPSVALMSTPDDETRASQQKTRTRFSSPQMIQLFATSAVFGLAEGSVAVTVVPLSSSVGGSLRLAGILLALLSVGSVIGGVSYSSLANRLPASAEQRGDLLLCLFGLALWPLVIVRSAVLVAIFIGIAGLFIAPFNAARAKALQNVITPTQRTQGFTLLSATYTAGFGLSGVLLAVLIGPLGPQGIIAVTAALGFLSGALALTINVRRARRLESAAQQR